MRLKKDVCGWFDYPDDPDGAAFEIKHLRAGEISKIISIANKRRYEFRKGKDGKYESIPVMDNDQNLEREQTIIEAISNWKNVLDVDGSQMECTNDNKLRLCRELDEDQFLVFWAFIDDCRKKLNEAIEKENEEQEKN